MTSEWEMDVNEDGAEMDIARLVKWLAEAGCHVGHESALLLSVIDFAENDNRRYEAKVALVDLMERVHERFVAPPGGG